MNDKRKHNQQPGRWMSEEEYNELVAAVQTALGVARIARRVLAEADDRIADLTTMLQRSRNQLKAQPSPKREQVL